MSPPMTVRVSVILQAALIFLVFVQYPIDLALGRVESGLRLTLLPLVGVAFWSWIAVATYRGRKWSRILQSILAALVPSFTVFDIATSRWHFDAWWYLNAVVSVAAVVLLWVASSRQYFTAVKRANATPTPVKPFTGF